MCSFVSLFRAVTLASILMGLFGGHVGRCGGHGKRLQRRQPQRNSSRSTCNAIIVSLMCRFSLWSHLLFAGFLLGVCAVIETDVFETDIVEADIAAGIGPPAKLKRRLPDGAWRCGGGHHLGKSINK